MEAEGHGPGQVREGVQLGQRDGVQGPRNAISGYFLALNAGTAFLAFQGDVKKWKAHDSYKKSFDRLRTRPEVGGDRRRRQGTLRSGHRGKGRRRRRGSTPAGIPGITGGRGRRRLYSPSPERRARDTARPDSTGRNPSGPTTSPPGVFLREAYQLMQTPEPPSMT